MKKKLGAILVATVLAFSTAAVIAPAVEANATPLYKCQKWNWWFGWRVVYTDDWRSYQSDGWQCYCIGQYP